MSGDSNSSTHHLAVLFLDIQTPFLEALPRAEAFLADTCFVASCCHELGIKTVITEQVPHKLGGTVAKLKALLPETPCFAKDGFSALSADGLEKHLETAEIEHVLIAGLETPICVYQTALDLLNHEIGVTLLTDAIACRRGSDGAHTLDALRAAGCFCMPSEAVFYSILKDSKASAFKAITQLVKNRTKDD